MPASRLVASDQMIVDWLWREGDANVTDFLETGNNTGTYLPNQQTAWWINHAMFQQGIAALGGGNVTVEAGRDVVNVSASTPTQGRVGGGRTATEAKTVAITGGGDLTVKAGRDIVGGVYYVDRGTGALTAGGAITSNRMVIFEDTDTGTPNPRSVPIRTVLALGDADLKITAGGNIDLHTASNPTLWRQSADQVGPELEVKSYFSTYGDDAALTLLSLGGDVTLWNTSLHLLAGTSAWRDAYDGNSASREDAAQSLVYYPGRVTAIAAAGDVTIQGGMVMYPSATGNLDLWAQHSVNLTLINRTGGWVEGAVFRNLLMSPGNPELLRTILRPRYAQANMNVITNVLHAADNEPSRIYANEGDITEGYGGTAAVGGRGQTYAEQVRFQAGRDINNLRLRAQNSNASDLSLFQAGRDLNLGEGRISIDGPGFVLAEAGRDVFLGRGQGIETNGNGETPTTPGVPPLYTNPFLPSQGAELLVLAGTADKPRYDDFIDAYLDPANAASMPSYLLANGKPIYLDELVAFMRRVTGEAALSEGEAVAAFQHPYYADHRKFLISKVLSRELRAAGRGYLADLSDEGMGFERGYAAIATLYPGADQMGNTGWQGDVVMDRSMIRTYRGGDVDILAPGGMLQVSALSSNAVGERDGVLTINGGEIRITTGLGTIINKSRVLTARGGEITIWSTYGDIDAGKGRKSSQSNPPRTYLLSLDANIGYRINPNFSGSGISTQKGTPDAAISDVDLYAPNGIINAGDAGISVSGNIFIWAPEIINGDNIQAGGEIKGLPEPTQSAATITVEKKDEGAEAAGAATQIAPNQQPAIIIVEVIGYGGGDGGDGTAPEHKEEERRKSKIKDERSYNPNGAVQILGHGDLSDEEQLPLSEEEKGRL